MPESSALRGRSDRRYLALTRAWLIAGFFVVLVVVTLAVAGFSVAVRDGESAWEVAAWAAIVLVAATGWLRLYRHRDGDSGHSD